MTGLDRLVGHVRVTHPFPSLLDGLVAGGAALAAGGAGETAVRLGVSMVLLQASVGALNDVVDAPHDAGHKPGKPIPAGLVSASVAGLISGVAGVAGLILAVPSGAATVGLAAGLLVLGYAYDLRFKGTAWSWLPFAVAIPLFPTYGWLGAAGSLPTIWGVLLPTAVLAGTALALGNAAVDVERDEAAGIASVATRLGRTRAATVGSGLIVLVVALAVGSLLVTGAEVAWTVGALLGGIGALAGSAGLFAADPLQRERGWKTEAVGVAAVAGLWLVAVTRAGLTG